MSGQMATTGSGSEFFDEQTYRLVRNVRTRRILAFIIDAIALSILTVAAGFMIGVLGFLTLGLGWLLYPVLFPCLALFYVAFTLGGVNSATPGMKAMGIEMRQMDGARPSPAVAAVHAILFYFGVGTFLILAASWVVSLLNSRKRMLHDIILGVVVVDANELRNFGY